MTQPVDRLYLVTRSDLEPGPQAVQAAHALREFAALHPELDKHWYTTSNTLAFLAAKDETSLEKLIEKATAKGVACAPFREPDLDNALTAVAFAPDARRILSHLPLALRCMK